MVARKPLQIFLAVQRALFLRELGMRFSVSKIGLFWTFFEPFMQVMILILIKSFIFGRATENLDYVAFLALNFTAYNMFKNITLKSMGSFSANRGLFIYKQVKPIDTIIARVMAEIFITGIIIMTFVAIGSYFNFDLNIQNLPLVALGFIWLILFSFSFGLFVAIINSFFPIIGNIISMLMIFLMFGSAVFYTIEMLPSEIQHYLLYNPLAHFFEMIHGHYFHILNDFFVDYSYMLLWTLILLYIGLWFYRKLEERIISL